MSSKVAIVRGIWAKIIFSNYDSSLQEWTFMFNTSVLLLKIFHLELSCNGTFCYYFWKTLLVTLNLYIVSPSIHFWVQWLPVSVPLPSWRNVLVKLWEEVWWGISIILEWILAGCGFIDSKWRQCLMVISNWKLLVVFYSRTYSLYACVVYRACCGYWTVQTWVYVCVCKWECVCVCELESPWVLFVLIKQQLYGTLDTLDQTPSHYWNITLPRAKGLHPVDASACQRCVWVDTLMCVSVYLHMHI